ncbi:MAG: TIGR02646 family protein [Planctomycetaceae bacterium]|jgi:uncharacterized protein (TIGR02646 family)|nr:TIGR02646 family protein [Planctomycetaceae bacterium]
MKQITKKTEPNEFIQWKKSFPDIVPGWDEFDTKPIKQVVKKSLLEEQGYICCFCETEVDGDHGHIAHLKDQQSHPCDVLNYNNMLYSCPENERGIPQTCGHRQKNFNVPISPLDVDCEERFIYIANGKMFPKNDNDNDANETIRILNLNTKHLSDARAKVIQEIFKQRNCQSANEFQKEFAPKLELQNGRFESFWTTKKYAATVNLQENVFQ